VEYSKLALCYKGDRDYLHGTDIYNAVTEHLAALYPAGDARASYFIFHAFARRACVMFVGGKGDMGEAKAPPIVEFGMSFDDAEVTGYLIESDQEITCRNPYDEAKIWRTSVVEGQNISVSGDTGFSAIEVAVALTKQLHNMLFPVPQGKWVFTKLELSRLLQNADAIEMEISLKSNFNNRLTKSALNARGKQIGHIYFSLVS
jgi:hypothetical protein